MTRTPTTHYCQKREAFITFSQTLRSCITANQCYSDDPCPHAQDFQEGPCEQATSEAVENSAPLEGQ
jgi:hypothetical protein